MNGLFSSTILDVAVGLIFVYLLLAIICTTINEWFAGMFSLRAKNLQSAIEQLLDGQTGVNAAADTNWFLTQFYAHPLIAGMHKGGVSGKGHPAYLPSRTFATAILDIVTPAQPAAIDFQALETGVNGLPNGDVKKALLALIQNADKDITKAEKNIETWFDDTMQRVGGWYKLERQVWIVGIATVLTLAANADTLRMTRVLWRNPTQRAQIVEAVKARAGQSNGNSSNPTTAELKDLDYLLGWGNDNKTAPESDNCWLRWALRVLGWFLTIVAVSLGAPFWFDLLNKIVNLRNAGPKPKTSQQQSEASATG